jgi:ADP-dependent NAD(P)H-hydrate dehydratase
LSLEQILDLPELPLRSPDAHKGDVGRIVVIGGSLGERGMVGAPAMTANGAFRSGAGLVEIITDEAAMPAILTLAPCATTRSIKSKGGQFSKLAVDFGAHVVAIGPGLGDSVDPGQVVALLNEFSGGIVVDADALNALAKAGEWNARWPHNVVLTPHPGEFRRLLDGYGMSEFSEKDRLETANAFATRTKTTVVLKGMGTIVTDGERYYINQTGNAGMATAGTGDLLTGMIAALIGQGMSAFDAAVLGVFAHGLAGDSSAEELGRLSMTALDILDALPEVFFDLEHDMHR